MATLGTITTIIDSAHQCPWVKHVEAIEKDGGVVDLLVYFKQGGNTHESRTQIQEDTDNIGPLGLNTGLNGFPKDRPKL